MLPHIAQRRPRPLDCHGEVPSHRQRAGSPRSTSTSVASSLLSVCLWPGGGASLRYIGQRWEEGSHTSWMSHNDGGWHRPRCGIGGHGRPGLGGVIVVWRCRANRPAQQVCTVPIESFAGLTVLGRPLAPLRIHTHACTHKEGRGRGARARAREREREKERRYGTRTYGP